MTSHTLRTGAKPLAQSKHAPEGASRCRVLTPLDPDITLPAFGLFERIHAQGGGSKIELPLNFGGNVVERAA